MISLSDLPPIEAVGIAAMGGAMTGYGIAFGSEARAMQRWPQVEGTIRRSEVEEYYDHSGDDHGQTLYRPAITYDFVVGDRHYRGERIEVAVTGTSFRSHAESIIARYPSGKRVVVYYDPANPRECLLERASAPGWAAAATILGIMLTIGGMTWVVATM